MRQLFTSDLHFGHVNIIQYCERPYPDVPTMNAGLVERWNAQVNDDDVVYVLGDLAMGRLAETIPHAKQLRGHKILILGNHDRAKPIVYREQGGFEEVLSHATLGIADTSFELSHYPFTGDSTETDRYLDRRPKNNGQWLLCGHVHDAWRKQGRQINVGIDAWGGHILTEDDVMELVRSKEESVGPVRPWVGA